MPASRSSSALARLVLAWFVLTLGVALASPMVAPKSMELVCSAGGSMQLLVVDQDGEAIPAGSHTLDCALCLPASLPLPLTNARAVAPRASAPVLPPIKATHRVSVAGAPLPPRGPPAHA